MLPRWSSLLRPAVLTMAALLLSFSSAGTGRGQAPAHGNQSAGYGGAEAKTPSANPANGSQASTNTGTYSSSSSGKNVPEFFEVVCPGGCYGGFHPCARRAFAGSGYGGFFRRYWGYGFYGPNYNMGSVSTGHCGSTVFTYVATCPGHGLAEHGNEAVCAAPSDLGGIPPGGGMNPPTLPASEPGKAPAEKLPPPTPNRAHLQLLVPEKAEVVVEGVKTGKTGTVRDFVSPPLTPGKNMTYRIAVRYTDTDGRPVEETHSVRVRANDNLRIDFTRPSNTEQVRAAALR
jgi:uncharacterized protein (TIGR03000 family)